MSTWTTADIPSQHGRSAVVTGTGGLGLQDAIARARAGADVTIAGRNADKGAAAVARVRAEVGGAVVRFEQVDLASLSSIAAFTERLRQQRTSLDILINNAGVARSRCGVGVGRFLSTPSPLVVAGNDAINREGVDGGQEGRQGHGGEREEVGELMFTWAPWRRG